MPTRTTPLQAPNFPSHGIHKSLKLVERIWELICLVLGVGPWHLHVPLSNILLFASPHC